jgi:hypothetical protein
VGAGALIADASAAVVVVSLLAAGAVEGATLGWGQAHRAAARTVAPVT